jgi:hypothetical protein
MLDVLLILSVYVIVLVSRSISSGDRYVSLHSNLDEENPKMPVWLRKMGCGW